MLQYAGLLFLILNLSHSISVQLGIMPPQGFFETAQSTNHF